MRCKIFIGEGVVGEMDGWVYFGLDWIAIFGTKKKKNKNHILLFAPAAP